MNIIQWLRGILGAKIISPIFGVILALLTVGIVLLATLIFWPEWNTVRAKERGL
jgi:hypothetical protein